MMNKFIEGDVSVEENIKTFKWKINDFLVRIQNPGVQLQVCQEFSMLEADGRIKNWVGCVKLYGRTELRFYFFRSDLHNDILVSLKICILNDKNLKVLKREANGEGHESSSKGFIRIGHFLDFNHLKENAATLLPGGALTILLEFKIHSSKIQRPQNLPRNDLSNDLNNAFTGMNHSDCVIHCGEDQKLDCHAFMLEARSPVFKAMLDSGFQVR